MNAEHYKKAVVGAVNSYIRMINGDGKELIDNTWRSTVTDDGTFHIHLIVQGREETITLQKDEWIGLDNNLLGNSKLKELANRFKGAKQ
ncbi:hypothetical protein D3C77_441510 [compost metagenome]